MEKQTYAQKISQQIIKALQDGTAPWQKKWSGADLALAMPYNPVTKTRYKGINALNLMTKSLEDNRWLTFKQATDLGMKIKKGDKSTTVVYSKFYELQDKVDENGNKLLDENQKPIKEKRLLDKPQLFYANVFNATQIDGIKMLPTPIKEPNSEHEFQAIQSGEEILNSSGANIKNVLGDKAFYLPRSDTITLPLKEQFESSMDYYSTALHELSHWSGHKERLNRDLSGNFGSESYAKEELRAEIGSLMLCADLGVDFDPKNHYAYLNSWVKVIEEKPSEIFKASSDAEKIRDFLLSFSLKKEKTQDETLSIETKPSTQTTILGADKNLILAKERQNSQIKEKLTQERDERYDKTASRLSGEFLTLLTPDKNHPYLKEKAILAHGIKVDKKDNLIVPFRDIEGKHWSNQVIKKDGSSYFEKNGKIGGNFGLIGADTLKDISTLIIAKDYATSASIFEATKIPVVMVGDVQNLSSVTQNILKSNLNSSILIVSDNGLNNSENMQSIKTAQVAKSFNLPNISPTFTTKELKNQATNFNDLAISRGLDRVKQQIDFAFKRASMAKEPNLVTQEQKNKSSMTKENENKKSIHLSR